jgi:hypothetical protein
MKSAKSSTRYIVIFVLLFFAAIGLVWKYSTITEPSIENIACDQQTITSQLNKCEFESIRSDSNDDVYLLLIDLKNENSYLVKMKKEGKQISWFCFPYIGSLYFYVSPDDGDLVFYRKRTGIAYLFSSTGKLIKETTISDLGLDKDLVTQDTRELKLSNGSQVRIIRDKGKYQLISTDENGNSITLLKQTD